MEGPQVAAERDGLDVVEDGAVLRITLNRAAAGNALNQAVMAGLLDALDLAARSDEIRVVALTAQGRNFCTGADISRANAPSRAPGDAPAARPRSGHLQRNINLTAHRLIKTYADLQLPVVVGVRGWAAGLGNTLALLGDYIVASQTAKFWAPFTRRGFTPDSGSTYLLPRLIGLPRAKEMLLLGRPVDGAKAERWGMINEVVSDGDLEEAVERAVQEFARAATVSVGLAKVLVHRNLDASLPQALVQEELMEEASVRSADFKEGIAAMMQKRDPDFSGR
jgi:2-(1,2-epoxy-1,2-dihydrophenyl)acetyl-CoA isomerase